MASFMACGLAAWSAILYFATDLHREAAICLALAVAWVVAKVLDRVYEAVRNG